MLLQCCAYGCVGICRVSYFDSVRDYLLSGKKVFFAYSRSLDGISRYRSVNFLVFVIFFVIIFNLSERLSPDCISVTLLLAYVFISCSL